MNAKEALKLRIELGKAEGQRWHLYGSTGFLGMSLREIMDDMGLTYTKSEARMENRETVKAELERIKPSHVLLAAGLTHGPLLKNVDHCEVHKAASIRTNVLGTLNVVDICLSVGIHCTVYATGCIYNTELNDGNETCHFSGYKEDDVPNFTGSFYSRTKLWAEEMIMSLLEVRDKNGPSALKPGVLVLRVRMPIADGLHPRSLVTKLLGFEKVIDRDNSMTVFRDLLPVSLLLSSVGESGLFNFVNPGSMRHIEVLRLFKSIVDSSINLPQLWNEKEQSEALLAKRCNCVLDASKLCSVMKSYGVIIPTLTTSITSLFKDMAKLNGVKAVIYDLENKENIGLNE